MNSSTHILFCGDTYYPQGGMKDVAYSGTLGECKAFFEGTCRYTSGKWAHIVDSTSSEIVLYGRCSGYPDDSITWSVQDD